MIKIGETYKADGPFGSSERLRFEEIFEFEVEHGNQSYEAVCSRGHDEDGDYTVIKICRPGEPEHIAIHAVEAILLDDEVESMARDCRILDQSVTQV